MLITLLGIEMRFEIQKAKSKLTKYCLLTKHVRFSFLVRKSPMLLS